VDNFWAQIFRNNKCRLYLCGYALLILINCHTHMYVEAVVWFNQYIQIHTRNNGVYRKRIVFRIRWFIIEKYCNSYNTTLLPCAGVNEVRRASDQPFLCILPGVRPPLFALLINDEGWRIESVVSGFSVSPCIPTRIYTNLPQ